MGLEFLREHGGRRVRSYPEQPELDPSDEPDAETDENVEPVDHEYEPPAARWARIEVETTRHSKESRELPSGGSLRIALVTRRRAVLDRFVRWARRQGPPIDRPPASCIEASIPAGAAPSGSRARSSSRSASGSQRASPAENSSPACQPRSRFTAPP